MKISVNWLKQFTDIDLSIDELVQKIGAQLGAVEEVIDLGQQYRGIIIAKVVSCEKHPNADKLSVCWIDDGGKATDVKRNEEGYVQVVCGAQNIREGLTVAWLPPGVTVPNTFGKEPFVLEARELRGVVSNGMIASAHELAIGDDHNGIVELDIEADPGTDFAEVYELNDHIIDIENKMFTHRPDCFGILGVAREIAGISGKRFSSPDWYKEPLDRIKPSDDRIQLEISNNAGELVPRFMAVALSNVKVASSPFIIQTYLARVGLKPINNIVDVTNYLMVLTGQPTHAYDADKLLAVESAQANSGQVVGSSGQPVVKLGTRMSRKGDKLKLLNGKEIELQDDSTVLITSGEVPVGVGGIMGGSETEVDESTKNIVLECANFDMYSVRRTSMKYGLFTDAVTRFNKGQSPLQNDVVLEEAVTTLQYVAGGQVSSDVCDIKLESVKGWQPVQVTKNFVNMRLGLDLSADLIATLLRNVEFDVSVHGEELAVTPPYWRTDIKIAEDIVEEIGRLHGFDHLPIELPKRDSKPAQKDAALSLKSQIRNVLSKAGANEVLTYSFVHGNLLDKVGQDRESAFKLSNALSPELQYYRQSLTPSLLEKVQPNIKAGYDSFVIFEIGKSHVKGEQDKQEIDMPMEFNAVSMVFAASDKITSQYKGAAFYQANIYLDALLSDCGASIVRESFTEGTLHDNPALAAVVAPYDLTRSAILKDDTGIVFGIIGEFKQSLAKTLKLPAFAAGFELGLRALTNNGYSPYIPLSRYPKVQQDISLKVDKTQAYQPIFDELQAGLSELSDGQLQTELKPLDIYEKGENKHFTFRLTAAHYQKTLKAVEINELLDKLAERTKQAFNAERI